MIIFCRSSIGTLLCGLLLVSNAEALSSSSSSRPNFQSPQKDVNTASSRRSFVSGTLISAGVIATSSQGRSSPAAWALDIDAFMEKELSSDICDEKRDKKCQPKLTEDQALCRFGQPSPETGNACLRAGMSTKRPSGVDAFGKVDRGEYARCKAKYVNDPSTDKLVKEWDCK